MTIAPATAPDTAPASLYQIALETQAIDGELAIAMASATSDDPEEVEQAEALITGLLQRANTNATALKQKANAICAGIEALRGRAAYLKQQAISRTEKSKADEAAAERLLTYLVRTMTALNPGQTKFQLPDFTLSSRKSESVVIDPDASLPADLCRHEITIKIPAGFGESGPELEAQLTEWLSERLGQQNAAQVEVSREGSPDKALVKGFITDMAAQAPEALALMPPDIGPATHGETLSCPQLEGAHVLRKRGWNIK